MNSFDTNSNFKTSDNTNYKINNIKNSLFQNNNLNIYIVLKPLNINCSNIENSCLDILNNNKEIFYNNLKNKILNNNIEKNQNKLSSILESTNNFIIILNSCDDFYECLKENNAIYDYNVPSSLIGNKNCSNLKMKENLIDLDVNYEVDLIKNIDMNASILNLNNSTFIYRQTTNDKIYFIDNKKSKFNEYYDIDKNLITLSFNLNNIVNYVDNKYCFEFIKKEINKKIFRILNSKGNNNNYVFTKKNCNYSFILILNLDFDFLIKTIDNALAKNTIINNYYNNSEQNNFSSNYFLNYKEDYNFLIKDFIRNMSEYLHTHFNLVVIVFIINENMLYNNLLRYIPFYNLKLLDKSNSISKLDKNNLYENSKLDKNLITLKPLDTCSDKKISYIKKNKSSTYVDTKSFLDYNINLEYIEYSMNTYNPYILLSNRLKYKEIVNLGIVKNLKDVENFDKKYIEYKNYQNNKYIFNYIKLIKL